MFCHLNVTFRRLGSLFHHGATVKSRKLKCCSGSRKQNICFAAAVETRKTSRQMVGHSRQVGSNNCHQQAAKGSAER